MSARPDYDCIVIGAGVVGLACAAELSRRHSTLVIETEAGPGRATSSRNSGVIHAGIYYPPDSLKAKTCVEGRELLYARADREGIAHRRTGKVVVAVDKREVGHLERLLRQGENAGVTGLRMWDAAALQRHEPLLRGVAALHSPVSGIVDAHGLIESYRRELLRRDGDVVLLTEVISAELRGDRVRLETRSHGETTRVDASLVVNAAGLASDEMLRRSGADPEALGLALHFCKGDYFAISRRPLPQTALVYPVPQSAGLGVHLTIDLGGRCVAGPDTTYVDEIDYRVDERKAAAFHESVARYFPSVALEDFSADYSGIRPKLQGPGEAFRDFVIHQDQRMVHLLGIESPGLTASESIGRRVAAIADDIM
ncbi:MAG: NAD(P)/FAD-dependent oxidoreductase [Myxococcota bacterium]